MSVHEKIRVKGGEKQFKSGRPGLTGSARLQRRVQSLLVAAARLARKGPPTDETAYAGRLVAVLQLFVAGGPDVRA
jgi:hypothetical protein